MALEIYWASGSAPAWRVLLTLAVKGVPYESKLLQFSKRETRTPEYLAVSPRGKVPGLRDGEFTLSESLAIMAYLEKKHPSPPLFGETPEETGTIWRVLCEHDNYITPAIQAVVRPILFSAPQGEDLSARIQEAAPTAHEELARLEAALGNAPWLAGERMTAADLGVFPTLKLLLRAAGKPIAEPLGLGFAPLEERYPRLAAWSARIEALPGYDATYPPHWREG
ncbi:MAG: glutathione S-transferase family protein [Polyangiaceae bacterium]|nr:glutathione S-transferase family protein [Polyangiaceae bacterium]